MGWHDPQDYTKAMGRYAGCALHSTLQAHPGAFVFLDHVCCTPDSTLYQPRTLSTAAHTTFMCTQAAAPVMRDAAKKELEESDQAKQRCIINVSSTSGTHGNAGQANYSTVCHLTCMSKTTEPISVHFVARFHRMSGLATPNLWGPVRRTCDVQAKAGVVGLSKTVAREWGAFNIRCNAIAYGFIATRLTASKDDGASISVNGEKVRGSSMQCSFAY